MRRTPSMSIRPTTVLWIILLSYLMIVVDISIKITALPAVRDSLSFSATGLSWVQSAYALAYGGLLLLAARAGDLFGRRRMFVAGMVAFTAASLVVGLAPTSAWFIAARALQGGGAAVVATSTLAFLSTSFAEGPERTRAVAYHGAVAGIGTSIGLVLGGVLTHWVSWRVAFLVNVPLGVGMLLLAPRCLPETERRPGKADVAGAFTSTVGMTALVYALIRSATSGWVELGTLTALVVGVLLLVLFVQLESRAAQPIVPLRLFASRERSGAYAARFLYLGAMMGFWFFMTQFLQRVIGFSPFEAGLAFLPMTMSNFAAAMAVPALTRRFGNGWLLAGGVTVAMAGMAWLSRVSVDTPYLAGIALPMVLLGISQGGALSPLTASGIAGVDARDAGAASGVVNVAHQLGGSLGLGLLVLAFATASGSGALGGRELLAHRVGTALTAGTILLGVALVVVLMSIVRRGKVEGAGPKDHT